MNDDGENGDGEDGDCDDDGDGEDDVMMICVVLVRWSPSLRR